MARRVVNEEVQCRRLTHMTKTLATYWIKVRHRTDVEFYCAEHYHSRMNELTNSDTPREHGVLVVKAMA